MEVLASGCDPRTAFGEIFDVPFLGSAAVGASPLESADPGRGARRVGQWNGTIRMVGVRELATGTAYVKSVRMCVRVWVLRCGSGGPLGN